MSDKIPQQNNRADAMGRMNALYDYEGAPIIELARKQVYRCPTIIDQLGLEVLCRIDDRLHEAGIERLIKWAVTPQSGFTHDNHKVSTLPRDIYAIIRDEVDEVNESIAIQHEDRTNRRIFFGRLVCSLAGSVVGKEMDPDASPSDRAINTAAGAGAGYAAHETFYEPTASPEAITIEQAVISTSKMLEQILYPEKFSETAVDRYVTSSDGSPHQWLS